jgi:hypothetical protein
MTQEIHGQTFHHLFFHGKMLAHIFSPLKHQKCGGGPIFVFPMKQNGRSRLEEMFGCYRPRNMSDWRFFGGGLAAAATTTREISRPYFFFSFGIIARAPPTSMNDTVQDFSVFVCVAVAYIGYVVIISNRIIIDRVSAPEIIPPTRNTHTQIPTVPPK